MYLCVYVVYVVDLIVPLTVIKKRCYVVIDHDDGKFCNGNVYCLLRTVRITRSAGDVPATFRTLITTIHSKCCYPRGLRPRNVMPMWHCDSRTLRPWFNAHPWFNVDVLSLVSFTWIVTWRLNFYLANLGLNVKSNLNALFYCHQMWIE